MRSAIDDEQAARLSETLGDAFDRATRYGRKVANNLRDESKHRAAVAKSQPQNIEKSALGRHARVGPPEPTVVNEKSPRWGASAGSHVALVKPAEMPDRQWCAGRRVAFNLILGNASRYRSLCSRTATEIFGLARPPPAQCALPQRSGAAGVDDDRRSWEAMRLEPPAEVTRLECSLPLGSASCSAPALRIEPHTRVARQQHFATDTKHYGEFSHTLRCSSGKTCRAAYGRPSGARSTCR
jgi:hypothetical protein